MLLLQKFGGFRNFPVGGGNSIEMRSGRNEKPEKFPPIFFLCIGRTLDPGIPVPDFGLDGRDSLGRESVEGRSLLP